MRSSRSSRLAIAAGATVVTVAVLLVTSRLATTRQLDPGSPVERGLAGGSSHPSSTPSSGQPAGFRGGVFRIGPFLHQRLIHTNWHPGCPVGVEDLRHVEVTYWDFQGRVRSGPLIVHESVANDVLWVFHRLFDARFPIHRIKLPPRYRPARANDWFSTRDRTAAFNCRPATGNPGSLSQHSYGWAIDINPLENPYVSSDGSVLRRAVKPYTDRSLHRPGMIHPGDVVVRSFARIGWEWGGDWVTLKDYMHFSLTGR
jgi:D-alanyl-D-alanine carboxypeptidase